MSTNWSWDWWLFMAVWTWIGYNALENIFLLAKDYIKRRYPLNEENDCAD